MTASFGDEALDRIGAPRIEERGSYPHLADVAFQDRPRYLWVDLLGHKRLPPPTAA
jgi:hypothetical protein